MGAVGRALQDVIGDIYGAKVALEEKRWLAREALALSMGLGGGRAGQQDIMAQTTIHNLEELLGIIGRLAGRSSKPTISVAKSWLRQHGEDGSTLAKRLGRISKRRNGFAHPDEVTLKADLLAWTPSGTASSDSECSEVTGAAVGEEAESQAELPSSGCMRGGQEPIGIRSEAIKDGLDMQDVDTE